MTKHEKRLMRTAIALHDQLSADRSKQVAVTLPAMNWQLCQALQRQMGRAHQRGWHRAARKSQRELLDVSRVLQGELAAVERLLDDALCESMIQSVRDLYADLHTLYEEFEDVSLDRNTNSISVTTEAIELDGVYLGAFEICLNLTELAQDHPCRYRVIALDPHPATPNESVTHPHVQDEGLCEGEGHHAIRRALRQGRLLDFFVIVANLLRTYNSSSPYVELADWNGMSCTECGGSMSDDDRCTCERCDSVVCEACHSTCPECGCSYCSDCVTRCEECDEYHCSSCLVPCTRCQSETCRNCLDDQERCSNCHDQHDEEECEETEDFGDKNAVASGVAEIQPYGLGEIAVPA